MIRPTRFGSYIAIEQKNPPIEVLPMLQLAVGELNSVIPGASDKLLLIQHGSHYGFLVEDSIAEQLESKVKYTTKSTSAIYNRLGGFGSLEVKRYDEVKVPDSNVLKLLKGTVAAIYRQEIVKEQSVPKVVETLSKISAEAIALLQGAVSPSTSTAPVKVDKPAAESKTAFTEQELGVVKTILGDSRQVIMQRDTETGYKWDIQKAAGNDVMLNAMTPSGYMAIGIDPQGKINHATVAGSICHPNQLVNDRAPLYKLLREKFFAKVDSLKVDQRY